MSSTETNFWSQAPRPANGLLGVGSSGAGGPLSMSALLFPAPRALSAGRDGAGGGAKTERVGLLPQGTCIRCYDTVCGGVNASTGRPLPDHRCVPSAGEAFGCYYDSLDECNVANRNQPQRQLLAATLSTAPFRDVMAVTYDQPSYASAAETFFAGRN